MKFHNADLRHEGPHGAFDAISAYRTISQRRRTFDAGNEVSAGQQNDRNFLVHTNLREKSRVNVSSVSIERPH